MSEAIGEISSEIISTPAEEVESAEIESEDQRIIAIEEDQEISALDEEGGQRNTAIEVDEDDSPVNNIEGDEEEHENAQRIPALDDDIEEENKGKRRDLSIHQLPFQKIKRLMRTDEDVNLISREAIITTAVAAELFVSQLAQQAGRITSSTKKRTLTLEHLKAAISDNPAFDFLQGAIPGTDI